MQVSPWFLTLMSVAVPLLAQTPPQPPSDTLPLDLRSYFAFTDDQVRQIVGINQTFQTTYGVDEATIARLQQQIAAETAKPDLNANALGTLYVAVEQARRDEQSARTQALNAINQLLTPAQLNKLQILQAALTLQPVITDAIQWNFLLAPASSPPAITSGSVFRKLPERLPSAAPKQK
jgi:hypothetical protein